MISRRSALGLLALTVAATAPIGSAMALDYPTRPVRWVVGYPPGGSTDIIARLIGQRLSEKLGQQLQLQIVQRLTPRAQQFQPLLPQLFGESLDFQMRPGQFTFEVCDARLGVEGSHGSKLDCKSGGE